MKMNSLLVAPFRDHHSRLSSLMAEQPSLCVLFHYIHESSVFATTQKHFHIEDDKRKFC